MNKLVSVALLVKQGDRLLQKLALAFATAKTQHTPQKASKTPKNKKKDLKHDSTHHNPALLTQANLIRKPPKPLHLAPPRGTRHPSEGRAPSLSHSLSVWEGRSPLASLGLIDKA